MLGGPEASKVQASGWQHFPGKSAGNWVYYTFQIVNYVVKFQVAVFSFFCVLVYFIDSKWWTITVKS